METRPDDNDAILRLGHGKFDPTAGIVPYVPPRHQHEEMTGKRPTRDEGGKESIAVRLVALVDKDDVIVDERGDAYAHVIRDGHRELVRVRCRAFRSYLAGRLYDAEEKAANGEALASARA